MFAAPPIPAIIETACPAEARSLERHVLCGHVKLPLDRADPSGKKIRIYFERYRRKDLSRPKVATVVSIEGGPGYPTSADRAGRVRMWRPLSARRALVLVDLRGTGRSHALRCASFAHSTRHYVRRVGKCARQIGSRRDFYSTSQAVQDVRQVLRAVHAGRVDLYGDSYGSYAAQAYALRYPGRLRSLALDGTYPVPGTDPAWADLAQAIRRGLRLSCARRPGCPARRHGVGPVALVASFARQVRKHPIVGVAPDGDGTPTHVRLDEDALVWLVSATYYYPAVYRDLPAAIFSARRGDTAPILRLAAETRIVDAGPAYPRYFSEALYVSVICHDYPQPWDPSTPVGSRRAEAESRFAAYPSGTFRPFSTSAWTGTDYEGVLACLRWPSPAVPDPPDPPGATYPDVPTLVLNGDLDTITPLADARVVARRFPNSTFVKVRNSFHVTALYDYDGCASSIYTRFVRSLHTGSTRCARHIEEVHVAPRFPKTVGLQKPARPLAGNQATVRDRRIAAAAANAVADVIARWWVEYDGKSVGLRGGTWSFHGNDPVHFRLRGVEYVPGIPVTGRARWSNYGGGVTARVTARTAQGTVARLRMRWSLHKPLAVAKIRGEVGSRTLRAAMLAP